MLAESIDVVIPAAGLGRRMKTRGAKSLISLGEEAVLSRQIRLLRECLPVGQITVVIGFEAEKVYRSLPHDVSVVLNGEYEDTNVAHSVGLALKRFPSSSPVLVVYGDLVFNRETLAGLDLSRSAVVADTQGGREDEVGVNAVDGEVMRLAYGLPVKWAHIALLCSAERLLFQQIALEAHRRRYFGYEILNEVMKRGGRFQSVAPVGMRLVEIDSAGDIDTARQILI